MNVINLPSRSLDVNDTYEFYEENGDLFAQMTPVVTISTVVKHGNDSLDATNVGGYSEDYLAIKDYELETGRNIQYSDIVSRQKVCVVGYYVAHELFGSAENALDQTLKISGEAYKIVGVVERQDDATVATEPKRIPITPPMELVMAASITNCCMMTPRFAPRALRMPISLVRSVTDTSMMFMTPIPPTRREMLAIQINCWFVEVLSS